VHLLDGPCFRPVSSTGAAPQVVPLDESLCRSPLATGEFLHVPDASKDPRFDGDPHVDGRKGNLRMYAGAPLRDPAGSVVGTLCVLSDRVHTLHDDQQQGLQLLGHQVSALLRARSRAVSWLERWPS
jgi:GAF domain-containing protein